MTLWCLGSVNLDRFYRVPHILAPGETLAAHGLVTGIGGKGANMSVAAARAGERVALIGAVGEDGVWARERLAQWGVDTRYLEVAEGPTGHAIIAVADDGEPEPLADLVVARDRLRAPDDDVGHGVVGAGRSAVVDGLVNIARTECR